MVFGTSPFGVKPFGDVSTTDFDTPPTTPIYEDAWHQALSEPSRHKQPRQAKPYRRSLDPHSQQFSAFVQFAPFEETSHTEAWVQPFSEPIRYRRQLVTADQQFLAFTQAIFVVPPPVDSYVQPFSQPVIFRRQLLTANQQFFVISGKPVVLRGSTVSFVANTLVEVVATSFEEQMLDDISSSFAYGAIISPHALTDRI